MNQFDPRDFEKQMATLRAYGRKRGARVMIDYYGREYRNPNFLEQMRIFLVMRRSFRNLKGWSADWRLAGTTLIRCDK
jgi:flagellar biosynthesis GTPase FlhF